jgi:hypothetical protein
LTNRRFRPRTSLKTSFSLAIQNQDVNQSSGCSREFLEKLADTWRVKLTGTESGYRTKLVEVSIEMGANTSIASLVVAAAAFFVSPSKFAMRTEMSTHLKTATD